VVKLLRSNVGGGTPHPSLPFHPLPSLSLPSLSLPSLLLKVGPLSPARRSGEAM